ncbi:UvrD-helicase domain-containing protein [Treponema sp. OMZ 305]|uniref:ATP-dependent helicase n=1 Tax=Treponema sp. OMZ 305 TaxID=1659192 RepID=UPI0020A2AFDD|nr:UvrD-helicase domain-containing protein [Treponema sp. OMZ 305]UTC58940.1 UvrD-helicase domain-containing protein [Treponema sp. OMZ 305]
MEESCGYLSVLNPEQLEAVCHTGSPLLILAGAGSGKTRVITTKIAWLIAEQGVRPESILAVTFTNKAAREMAERAQALDERAGRSSIRTFHSFGAWMLRRYAEWAGLSPNFTIYDDDDSVTLLMKALPQLNKQEAQRFIRKISRAKDYCLLPDSPQLTMIDPAPEFAVIYRAYQQRLRETGNADFGDLIMLPVQLLQEHTAIAQQLHRRFKVILVDEYQDSNSAQFQLLRELTGEDTYVCVVGDDDQSIYRFRGAEVQNILTFDRQFPHTKIIRLVRNYRSYEPILRVADSVVSCNEGRLGKTLIAARGTGGQKPSLYYLPSQDAEAELCVQLIKKAVRAGGSYSDWAILYRTNAQSLNFETTFLHEKIPHKVVGTLKFYEREEIKDALALLALIANGRDEIAFRRMVNKPARGIGETTQNKLVAYARAAFASLSAHTDTHENVGKAAKAGSSAFDSSPEQDNEDAQQEFTQLQNSSAQLLQPEFAQLQDTAAQPLQKQVQPELSQLQVPTPLPSQQQAEGTPQQQPQQGADYITVLRGAGAKLPISKKAGAALQEFLNTLHSLRSLLAEYDSANPDTVFDTANATGTAAFDTAVGTDAHANSLRSDVPTGSTRNTNTSEQAVMQKHGQQGERLAAFVLAVIEQTGLGVFHRNQDEVMGTQKTANLQELANTASLYPCSTAGLTSFLEHIELDRSLAETEAGADAVQLITMHNTKGLEFRNVIITGLENGIFPRNDESAEDMEEERRLMYVACTRAQDALYMTSCAARRMYGKLSFMEPSRFLAEIDSNLIDVIGQSISGSSTPADEEAALWKCGQRLYHDDYGYGYVVQSRQSGGELVITVQFETGSQKRFFPAYQKSQLFRVD